VEYPTYWTYSEWTEGFLRLLDFLKLDEVGTGNSVEAKLQTVNVYCQAVKAL